MRGNVRICRNLYFRGGSGIGSRRAAYYMEVEQPSGPGQGTTWRTAFQRIYLSRFLAALRRQKMERPTSVKARTRAVKLAADLSLAMTERGRTAWSRAIIDRYILRLNKSESLRRLVKSGGNSVGKRRSVIAKTRSGKPNRARKNPTRWLSVAASRPRGTTYSLRSRDNCDEEAEGTVASRMQDLRALIPGSHGLDTPVFLTEVADYIVALKMQVQVMHELANEHSNSIADSACQD